MICYPPRAGSRDKRMRAGVATSPHFPGVDRYAFQHGAFPGRIRFRAKPCDLVRFPLGFPAEALRPRQVPSGSPIKANFDEIPFAVPLPKAPVPPDVVGKWERHRLSLLPHASSFDRPTSRLPAIILAGMSAASAVAVTSSFRSVSGATLTRHENHAAPAYGVAPSGIRLWVSRIAGITLALINPREAHSAALWRPCGAVHPYAEPLADDGSKHLVSHLFAACGLPRPSWPTRANWPRMWSKSGTVQEWRCEGTGYKKRLAPLLRLKRKSRLRRQRQRTC